MTPAGDPALIDVLVNGGAAGGAAVLVWVLAKSFVEIAQAFFDDRKSARKTAAELEHGEEEGEHVLRSDFWQEIRALRAENLEIRRELTEAMRREAECASKQAALAKEVDLLRKTVDAIQH